MLLINSHEGALRNDNTALFGGPTNRSALILRQLWAHLQGEEKSSHMLYLLALLVLLLHIWLLTLLKKPDENVTEAKPLPMEVSIVTIAPPKPVVEPPKPAPPPPPPPKVSKPKPVLKKPAPVAPKAPAPEKQEAPDFAPFEPFKPAPPQQSSPSATTNSTSTTPTANTASNNDQPVKAAGAKAGCIQVPKPIYPAIARNRGWEGRGVLLIKVSAQGVIESVAIEKSSGHEILDDAAIEAAKKWQCTPQKRGDTALDSRLVAPFNFNLLK